MRERRRIGVIVGVLGVGGCWPVWKGPQVEGESETSETGGSSSSGSEVPTSGGGGSTTGTSGGVASESTGSGSTAIVGESSGSSGGGTFIVGPDEGGGWRDCDNFAQDCPDGQKCVPYAANGGSSWDSLKCVPVMENAVGVGEECFVVGNGVTGIDNCEFGAYCWDTDQENKGTCVAQCTGSPESPMCPPKSVCVIYSDAVLNLCLDSCDPLAQDCEYADDVCIGNPSGDGFLCVIDGSGEEGQVHDPCEYANACDEGLLCLNSQAAVECDPAASGCCEPFCALGLPNTCPGAGQVCNPYYEIGMAPPEYENVGYCAVPQ